MSIIEKTITTYTTSDGETFKSYSDALKHEKSLVDVSNLEFYALDCDFNLIDDPLAEEGIRAMSYFICKNEDIEQLAKAFVTISDEYGYYTPFDPEYFDLTDYRASCSSQREWVVFSFTDEWAAYNFLELEKICKVCGFSDIFLSKETGKIEFKKG